jgi:hypothetical protein
MRILAQGAIPILIFSTQSGLYAQFPVIRAVVNDSSPDGRLSNRSRRLGALKRLKVNQAC